MQRLLPTLALLAALQAVAAPAPALPAEGSAQLELDISLGHESSSSPLVRVSDSGALVAVPGLSRLAGTVGRASVNASAEGVLTGDLRWTATGVVDARPSRDAPGLGFQLGLADGALRWPLAGGTLGLGPSVLALSVGGRAFRQTAAMHLDWMRAPTEGLVQVWRIDLARHRHAADFSDLDAEVVAPSCNWQWAEPGLGLSKLDLGWGLRSERNRQGLPELSNRGAHLLGELGWDALGTAWSLNLMLQRTVFAAAVSPDLPARRDTLVAVDLSAQWRLAEHLDLRASVGTARNRARPWLYENRHSHAELGLSAHW